MQAQTAIHGDATRSSVAPRIAAPIHDRSHTAHVNPHADVHADTLDQTMRLMGAQMSYSRNSEIFGENEPAEYLYKVVSGSVRTYKILSDGRRQIGGFYLPGDIFGLEFADQHALSAEAITDVKVLVVKRSAINSLAGRDATVSQQLFTLTGRELHRAQDHILLLIKSAQERVASFLLEMSERGRGGNAIELPMSRQDIADYLGLTIETVSRTLSLLEDAAAIEVPTSRRIVLRNRPALNRLNG
ncbi:MAG TPA: helix-turn-helix domain-containing protein [Xanthobacteraceae bacterium]|nr:helix-turn-helix domain-containing protein [Xanthobacteraceae bacterium]